MAYLGDTQFNNPVYDDTPTGTTTITVTPDFENGTYTISNLWGSQAFTAADASLSPEPNRVQLQLGTPLGAAFYHRLNLFNNLIPGRGTNAPSLQFHYLSYGLWASGDAHTGGNAQRHFAAFVFGTPTNVADLPKTGTASYALGVTGALALSMGHSLSGDGTLTADFAAGKLDTQLNLIVVTIHGTYLQPAGRFSGSASFGSNNSAFQGLLTSSDTALSGKFTGSFYGPGAAEVGYTFAVRGPVGANRPGAEQTLVGVAIGKKK